MVAHPLRRTSHSMPRASRSGIAGGMLRHGSDQREFRSACLVCRQPGISHTLSQKPNYPAAMDVRVTSLGETPLIETQGDIDHSTCGSIETALREVLEAGSDNVLIDLGQVTYIDSGGLSVLLSGVRQMRDRGTLGVIGPNTNVQRLLEIVGLLVDPSFQVYEDRETASAALGGG